MSDFLVSLTSTARQFEAQQLIYGYGFQIQYYVLGSGGHDPGNPTVALPINQDVNLSAPIHF